MVFLKSQNGWVTPLRPPSTTLTHTKHTHRPLTPSNAHNSSFAELLDLLWDKFLVHLDNLLRDKLFARRQSSCTALTAPLSHKWFLKSRKQMRAKAPFKVHLGCLKSIYTHILLRSLLYELLINSTFCYPTFSYTLGKENKPEKQRELSAKSCTTEPRLPREGPEPPSLQGWMWH